MPGRLKALELHGFKTFASRTSFAFAGMITAIVGPNGSGKSNIADSIRWVLGEQAYGLLRAKKTEDMIFAGSEHRPRAGMASTTILFDNSDGWLPIDFVEVAITRRAYRDGQNEYLINGQRVRLKDVSELLAQSGLAERTYTIIGQGLVDAALALKAEDRRRLFEEAAGIGLHRYRREEALRRLESTRRNLERVQDIMAELQPRVRSLERQARRVQEYEQVKADLNVLLREWYGYHWHCSQKEFLDSKEVAHNQEKLLERSRQAQAGLNQKMMSLVSQIQVQRGHLNNEHQLLSELHNQRQNISRELVVTDERIRSLTTQQHHAVSEINRLEEDSNYQQERIDVTRNQIANLTSEHSEAQTQMQMSADAMKTRQLERQKAEQAVQAARQKFSSATARQAHLSARLGERKAMVDRQREQITGLQEAIQKAISEQQNMEIRLLEDEKLFSTADELTTSLEKKHQEQRAVIEGVEANRRLLSQQQAALQTSLARLQAQLDVLGQAERSLAGYASGARYLLQAVRQSNMMGVLGILSSQIEVQSEMEQAIAAVLGEFLDAVVFLNEHQLDNALGLLDGANERSALLSLDGLQPIRNNLIPDYIRSDEDILSLALDQVKFSPQLEPLIQIMLNQVLIVRTRSSARRVVTQLRQKAQFGWRVVTLHGEVFHANGSVLAGQEGKSGTLSRPRQRRELHEKYETERQASEGLAANLKKLDNELMQLGSVAEQTRQQAQGAVVNLKKTASQRSQAEIGLEKVQNNVRWQQDQLERIRQEISRGDSNLIELQNELQELDSQIDEARQGLRLDSAALSALSLDEHQTQLAHWNTRLAVASQALIDARKRLGELQTSFERTKTTYLTLKDRSVEFSEQTQILHEQKKLLDGSEAGVSTELETLQQKIRPLEEQLSGYEKDYAHVQIQEAEARQSLSLVDHQFAQARITQVRRQEALDSLHRRIEEDFGLVAFRYAESISGPTPLPLEGLVEQLPVVEEMPPELDESIKRQRAQLRRIGPVNSEVEAEFTQVKQRFEFLTEQVTDLHKAEEDIKEVIAELDLLMEREFRRTFDAVAHEFRQIFTRLFGGGSARLVLTSPEDMSDTGIDIEARLPGRREQGLSLLSGGERSLTASALVFALLKVSPTPFCVLDEVDAMLDEANVGRFRDLLRELSEHTQFVVVTHNRNTVQAADVIYGVTMGADSTSQVISLKLDEISQVVD